MLLITNPDWELLGGPCLRCDRYYRKRRRGRQKGYCSNKCRSAGTALSSQRKRRAQQRDEMRARAERYIEAWLKTDRSENWMQWVSRTGRTKYGLTKNWLTLAVNEGWLRNPELQESGTQTHE